MAGAYGEAQPATRGALVGSMDTGQRNAKGPPVDSLLSQLAAQQQEDTKRLHFLLERLGDKTDRLLGEVPQDRDQANQVEANESTMIGLLQQGQRRISLLVHRLGEVVERLERL